MKIKLCVKKNKQWKVVLVGIVLALLVTACAPDKSAEPITNGYIEEEVQFIFGDLTLYGVLTLPDKEGPFPAIVLVSGSGSSSGEPRDGVDSGVHILHAQRFVADGFAVLRYDPPGIGKSTGVYENASIEKRVEETHAAVSYLLSRSDILPKHIGLWGGSQGCWVIAMTAANYPAEIAFIISVSGAAVSPAEQQVYSVISQSKALGMSEESITKATIFAKLLIDMSLQDMQLYEETNRADAVSLGEGPWNTFMQLVYDSDNMDPNQKLQEIIAVLESVQDEGWTTYLFLKNMYIPALKSITPEQLVAQSQSSAESLLIEPKEFLTRVTCPVLAIWGEKDPLMPATQSAELFRQYLTEAGNDQVEIVIFPNADHSINGLITAYWETISDWLNKLNKE